MKCDITNLDMGQLDFMWNFLRMGHQKPNIKALKENCDALRRAMIQKTGGHNRKTDPVYYVSNGEMGTIINNIVIEAMCLYLSGDLDFLESRENKNDSTA